MDISVTYDASVLTATGVANGMMITSLPNVIVAHDISAGRVNISFATYPETVNGDGELFVVTFDADAAGNSTLDITVEEAWTGDVPPQPVAPVTVNGYVNVTSTTPSHDPADTNHDCVVDMMELMAHISKWKSGEVGMMELMTSIGRWKLGTGGHIETTDGLKTINEVLNMLFSRVGMFVAVMLVLGAMAWVVDDSGGADRMKIQTAEVAA
jgi:hypothetical protein